MLSFIANTQIKDIGKKQWRNALAFLKHNFLYFSFYVPAYKNL
jgi:hypothetical protein